MNVWDYLIIGTLVALAIAAVVLLVRRKKRGGCCSGCSGCAKGDCPARKE